MAKNNVLIYTDCIEQMECLSMEERGILFTAIMHYQAGLPMPEMDKLLNLVFIPIRQQLDRDNEAYVRKCEKNKENIRKRWERTNTNEYDRIRSDTKNTDNDNENDKDNDTDNDNENDNDINVVVGGAPQPTISDYEGIVQRWNDIPHTTSIKSITPCTRREDELRVCIGMFGMDGVMQAIDKVAASKYLKRRGDVVFDRYMNRNTIQGLLEGAYDQDYNHKEVKESDGYEWNY